MQVSPEVQEILEQVRTLRQHRDACLRRDMHYIDAEYDRAVRRVQASALWNRSSCECFSSKPLTFRRFYLRRKRWLRRRFSK